MKMRSTNKMCAAALFLMMTGGLVIAADTTAAVPV